MAQAPVPQRAQNGDPKQPRPAQLGMKATLLFPNKEIVEQFY